MRTRSVAPTGAIRSRGERMRDRESSVTTRTVRTRSDDSVRSRGERMQQRRERNRPED